MADIAATTARAGAAICPATPVATLADVAADGVLDLALCMSVNPGWGNQKLIRHSFQKLRELRAVLPATIGVEVDGGVSAATARSVAEAGAKAIGAYHRLKLARRGDAPLLHQLYSAIPERWSARA